MRISFSEAFSQTLVEFKITAKELAIKTGVTLPQLVDEVAELSARVEAYLKRMGANYG